MLVKSLRGYLTIAECLPLLVRSDFLLHHHLRERALLDHDGHDFVQPAKECVSR